MRKQIIEIYDWHEIVNEIERKHKVDLRDYGKGSGVYLDFWHYAIDHIFYDITNGCDRYFDPWESRAYALEEDGKEWVVEILDMFIKLFEENGIESGIEVRIAW